MVDERTTPEDELEVEAGDTPAADDAAEQATDAAPEDRQDQSAPGHIAQAEYTRATQLNAAVRKELGLPKGATIAEVLEALRSQAVAPASDDEEPAEEVDPRLVAAQQRAFEAELRVQRAAYGEEFATDALELFNAIRTSDDLEELFTGLAAFRDSHPTDMAPQQEAPAPEAEPEAEEEPEAGIGMSEGERATQGSTPSGRRESGVAAAIRGLFDQASAARPPR